MSCPLLLLRRLAFSALCLTGISIPGTELVHGFAHHEAAHHRDDAPTGTGNALTAPDHHGEHPHREIDRALTVRLDGADFAAPLLRGIQLPEPAVLLRPSAPNEAGGRRWTSTHAPPAAARAPPTA
jgi:hypothetical protein